MQIELKLNNFDVAKSYLLELYPFTKSIQIKYIFLLHL